LVGNCQADGNQASGRAVARRRIGQVAHRLRWSQVRYSLPVKLPSVLTLAVLTAVLCGTVPLAGHHSFAAQYDAEKPFKLAGTVTVVEWTNPHMHFSIEVKDEKGGVARWRFECYPPNMLVRQGWKRDETLKQGTLVTVSGWLARIEPNLGAAREITFADGRKIAAGPPAGTGGQ
jgi:hypothetical protein